MPRQNKIEKFGCQEVVAAGLRADPPKSTRQIAEECSEWAGEKISHTAVARYIESTKNVEQREKKEAIVADRRRIVKQVNQEFDIIQTQFETTQVLLDRFKLVDDLPNQFKEQMDELVDKVMEQGGDAEYLERWQIRFEKELRRKVSELTALNRELRENSKFLSELREKAFEFSLVQEYLSLFMDFFRDASIEAYEVAIQKVAANPRMQKIVDQQMQMRGE